MPRKVRKKVAGKPPKVEETFDSVAPEDSKSRATIRPEQLDALGPFKPRKRKKRGIYRSRPRVQRASRDRAAKEVEHRKRRVESKREADDLESQINGYRKYSNKLPPAEKEAAEKFYESFSSPVGDVSYPEACIELSNKLMAMSYRSTGFFRVFRGVTKEQLTNSESLLVAVIKNAIERFDSLSKQETKYSVNLVQLAHTICYAYENLKKIQKIKSDKDMAVLGLEDLRAKIEQVKREIKDKFPGIADTLMMM